MGYKNRVNLNYCDRLWTPCYCHIGTGRKLNVISHKDLGDHENRFRKITYFEAVLDLRNSEYL